MELDPTTVDWARAQFALTAMYHWLFVPITLGLSFICAFLETIYVRTKSEEWKRITRFWMTLFGINFAIGIATGIIMEFEFGTNWSNYSWMMGDIFGAPLAIEGIVAFFLEATFFAVMFFGWERVSTRFHLLSTWMVAIGSNLSALWILVANGWMQNPVGMVFNPDTVRFEMENFWAVLFNPVAMSKFTHTVTSSYVVSACFVIAVSSWYLLRGRHTLMAKRSIAVAALFGVIASLATALTGDEAAFDASKHQPMKMAAFEGLYEGHEGQAIVAFGVLNPAKEPGKPEIPEFTFEIAIPHGLSMLADRSWNGFVPGIDDLLYGNKEQGIMGVTEKMERGKAALEDLAAYKLTEKTGNRAENTAALQRFRTNEEYMGYGHLEKAEDAVPPVALTFYSFHYMVYVGSLIIALLSLFVYMLYRGGMKGEGYEKDKWLHLIGIATFPMMYLASELGWVVAEVGRQPWVMEGRLLTSVASTHISAGNVQVTFFIFLILFTALAAAEVGIMVKQINLGPETGLNDKEEK